MRALFYSDLHVNSRYPEYLEFLSRTVDFLCSKIEEVKPDVVICLGDIMDTFGLVSLRDLLWAHEALWKVTEKCPGFPTSKDNHIILSGNHDVDDKDCKISSVKLFRDIALPVTSPRVLPEGIACFPFGTTLDELVETLGKNPQVTLVAGHLDWIGGQLSSSYATTKGLDPSMFAKLYPKVSVVNGHYHSPGQTGPVHFVGSPLYRNFADFDSGIPRGFVVWTDGKLERIENPHTYRVYTIKASNDDELALGLSQIKCDWKAARVRFFVPQEMAKKIEVWRGEFLWCGVQRVDFVKEAVDKHYAVSVVSTKDQVVAAAVQGAPEPFDKKMLWDIGCTAFGVSTSGVS